MSKILVESPDGVERHLIDSDLIQTAYEGWSLAQADQAETLQADMLRAELWGRVKAIRDAKEFGNVPTSFGVVQGDEKSKQRISGAAQGAVILKGMGMAKTFTWTLADDSPVDFSVDEMAQFGLEVMGYVDACFNFARELRSEIEAATTPSALNAIDVESGWP